MVADPATGALKPLNFREISDEIPALRRLGVTIECHEGFTPIDSSDTTPRVWARLAEAVRDNYEAFDGFVVLHGTDTMSYTASALSFMLENLTKPVVFTGSQIPIVVLRTDGRENLVTAVEIAAARTPEGLPRVPEVSIYFQNRLFRANRTTKWSAEQLNAFTSENYPPLAEVGVSIQYNDDAIRRPEATETAASGGGGLRIFTDLCRRVALVRLFPGLEPDVLQAVLGVEGLRGVVLQTYGAGNTPTAAWFLDALRDAMARGVVVLNVTQCPAGGVAPIYESGVKLAEAGVVSGGEMTTEAAITKMMYVLGLERDADRARRRLAREVRGEIN
jgi:L-asparaginase